MLLALVAGADRAGAALAARAVASELQRTGGLAEPPDVTIGGVPLLTQAVDGRYRRIDLTARDVPAGQLQGVPVVLRSMSATLRGARVPLSDALARRVTAVPVERLDARVLVPYAVFARSSGGRQLTVAPEGDRLRVQGRVRVLGRELTASALSRLTVEGDVLVVSAESYDVGGQLADRLVTRAVGDRLDLRLDLGGLPYGLQVDGVRVRPDGVAVTAGSDGAVLQAPTG